MFHVEETPPAWGFPAVPPPPSHGCCAFGLDAGERAGVGPIGHPEWRRDPSDRSIASGDDLEIGRTGVASLRWDQRVQKRIVIDGEERVIDGFEVVQEKNAKRTGGKKLFLPITPMLAEALAPLKVDDGTVLKTGYGRRPRPSRSLAPWLIGPTWQSCRLA